jgi:hypothetical protein
LKTFTPLDVPNDPAALPGFLRQLQAAIQQAANRAEPFTRHQIRNVEPARSSDGDEVEADGVNWNPGSGAGKYVKRAGAWVFIG